MKIGFVGGGRIASALADGFVSAQIVGAEDLLVTDRFPDTAQAFVERVGAVVAGSPKELVGGSDVVFLCVKPGDVDTALSECGDGFSGKLLISVAAGISLGRLQELAGENAFVCRSMPNTAARVGLSCTAVCFSENCSEEHRAIARDLFSAVGEVFDVPEKLFDAVVGVSGSGPAYACLVIEAMADGGVRAGLPRETAQRMAALAVRGAAALILETGEHPAALRDQISSPGGTTIEALRTLEKSAARAAFSDAVVAAAKRSQELGAG